MVYYEVGETTMFLHHRLPKRLLLHVKNQHVKETKCIAIGDPYFEWEFG